MSEGDKLTGRWLTKTLVGGFAGTVIALAAAGIYGLAVDAVDGPPLTVEVLGHPFDNEAPPLWTSALVTDPNRSIAELPDTRSDGASWGHFTWDWSDVAVMSETIRLALRSNAEEPVVIERFEPRILDRTEALRGWYIADAGCGGLNVRQGWIDLDRPNPQLVFGSEDGSELDIVLFVHKGEMEVVQIVAHTDAHFVEWELLVHFTTGSETGVVTVRRADGGPFRISSGIGSKVYTPDWDGNGYRRIPEWDNGISIC